MYVDISQASARILLLHVTDTAFTVADLKAAHRGIQVPVALHSRRKEGSFKAFCAVSLCETPVCEHRKDATNLSLAKYPVAVLADLVGKSNYRLVTERHKTSLSITHFKLKLEK